MLRPKPQRHDAAPSADPVVSLSGIGADVERMPVLRGVDITVDRGQVLGLVGANGSGKSTLLRVLATLLPPSAGTGRVLGARLGARECARIRPRIALVGHVPALYPHLTLAENLRLVARLTGVPEVAMVDALATVGLADAAGRRADRCSHGMQRRAELARVLATEPDLLLLDEAHAGLDTMSRDLVDRVADRVRHRGGACVAVSHDGERLRWLADRVVELVDGRLHEVGKVVHR